MYKGTVTVNQQQLPSILNAASFLKIAGNIYHPFLQAMILLLI